jgi:hypothetical protein
VIQVRYEGYETFSERFGHLFWESPYSDYDLRVEYRFVGEQVADGPGWAWRNSGVMFHAQDPVTMGVDQDFPISLEAQFLGGDGVEPRPTANLCTPGTHVDVDGTRSEAHCHTVSGPTIHGDAWVTVELSVRTDSVIAHVVGGDTVITYARPVVGGGVVTDFLPDAKVDGTPLRSGWIALQSESHPVDFRGVWIRPRMR